MANWEESFKTQAQIKRAIILHGNTQDIFFQSNKQTGTPIIPYIQNILNGIGWNQIVVWNQLEGARGLTPEAQNDLSEDVQASVQDSTAADPSAMQNTAPPIDLDLGLGSEPAATPTSIGESTRDAAGFFNILRHRFTAQNQPGHRRNPTVYIIDGGDALFGNSNALSEAERVQLLQLGNALRDSECSLDNDQLESVEDLLIIITPRQALIPPRFYQDNPSVEVVNIPKPDRKEREKFMSKFCHQLWVSEPLHPGTRDFQELVDSLDGFTVRDMQQLIRLSHKLGHERLSFKRLIQLYRFGEKKSPWEELNHDRLKQLGEELKNSVKGQDHIIDKVQNVLIKAFMGLSGLQHSGRQQMPKGIFFFVGPTGVGKTEMAKAIARFLFGEEEACIRFDMSEFSTEHSDQRLVGAPPGYVGYEEGGQLTNAVRQRPFSVLLFDEIEKANTKIFDKFLQILEDGRLTDGKGDTVSFSESVIIFTSNIGASEVEVDDPNAHEAFISAVKEKFVKEMKRPELLNRIGEKNILPFNFLTDENVLLKIAASKLMPLRQKLDEKYSMKLEFKNEEAVLRRLLKGFNTANGGRGIANRVNDLIIEPLAMQMFEEFETDELHGATVTVYLNEKTSEIDFMIKPVF
ncbi:MAG: AAA family ATPase [Thermoguttaceae bacterium]|nr:AAA family ATPase [Thermoguttaceae bacterium]